MCESLLYMTNLFAFSWNKYSHIKFRYTIRYLKYIFMIQIYLAYQHSRKIQSCILLIAGTGWVS